MIFQNSDRCASVDLKIVDPHYLKNLKAKIDDTIQPENLPEQLQLDIRGRKPVKLNDVGKTLSGMNTTTRERGKISKPMKDLFADQAKDLTQDVVDTAIEISGIPDSIIFNWEEGARAFGDDALLPAEVRAAERGARIAETGASAAGLNIPKIAGTGLLPTHLDPRKQRLIKSIVDSSRKAQNVSLQSLIGQASNSEIRGVLQSIVGLTPDQAASYIKQRNALIAGGVSPARADKALATQANIWRQQRIARFADTELANGYNEGLRFQVTEGVNSGVLVGDRIVKVYITVRDANVCPICEPLDGKIVGFESPFVSDTGPGPSRYFSYQIPPLHVGCRCVIVYVTYV